MKRLQFRRLLASLLAVVMVVTVVPPSAVYAAEDQNLPSADITADDSDSGTDVQPAAEQAQAQPSGYSGDGGTAESGGTVPDTEEDTPAVPDEKNAEEAAEPGAKAEAAEDEVEQQEAAAKKAEIVIDYDAVADAGRADYDVETGTFSAVYDRKEGDTAFSKEVEEIKRTVTVTLNGEESRLSGLLEYKWQRKNGDVYADMTGGSLPGNAGEYRYVITLPDDAELHDHADPVEIGFVIEKCRAVPAWDGEAEAGQKVSALKEEIKKGYQFEKDPGLKALVSEVTVEIVKRYDAEGGRVDETLADDYELKTNEEYAFRLKDVKWADDAWKDNYEVSADPVRISNGEEISTEIRTAEGSFGKVYDGTAINEEDIKNSVQASVIAVTEENPEAPVADAKLEYTWLDADENELKNGADDVRDAGAYFLKITYAGEEGRYQKAEPAVVKVAITKAEVYVGDIKLGLEKVYSGYTAGEVRRNVTGYQVYQTDGGKPLENFDKNYFWGVSYNDTQKRQSYEPLFVVEKGTAAGDKVVWTPLGSSEKLEKKDGVSYRIKFSGQKTVYGSNNPVQAPRPLDVNAGQHNYTVDVSAATLEKYALPIDVDLAEKIEIDVAELLGENEAGRKLETPYTKIYDGEPLYGTRKDYKEKVKAGDKTGTDPEYFSYQWMRADSVYPVTDADGKESLEADWALDPDPDGDEYNNGSTPGDHNNDVEDEVSPRRAGLYRLCISYSDPTHATYAPDASVYYVIQPRDVYVKPEGTLEAYIGADIESYLESILPRLGDEEPALTYSLLGMKDGSPAEEENLPETLRENLDYRLEWYVERLLKDGSGKYAECEPGETFMEGETYRLGVRAVFKDYDEGNLWATNENYNNRWKLDAYNARVQTADKQGWEIAYENGSLPIALKASEGIELDIDVDWSKVTVMSKTYDGSPIDMAQIKDAVTVRNKKTGDLIDKKDVELLYLWDWSEDYLDDPYGQYKTVEEAKAVHRGDYTLRIIVKENGKYRYFDSRSLFNGHKFTVNPAKLTVTPNLNDPVKAGVDYSDTSSENFIKAVVAGDPSVEGAVNEADQAWMDENRSYIQGTTVSWPALLDMSLSVTPKQSSERTNYLRTGVDYQAVYSGDIDTSENVEEWTYSTREVVFYAADYEADFRTVSFTPVRGASVVSEVKENGQVVETALNDTVSPGGENTAYAHEITPKAGIKHTRKGLRKTEEQEELPGGNYFVFKIASPLEYTGVEKSADKAFHNIRQKGGYILKTEYSTPSNHARVTYTVAFEASKKDRKEFEITWEEGYTEKFAVELKDAILLEDLTRAVAPKSLAFNNAQKKMAIGEQQQLDLKITKAQMADIIFIGYRSSDDKVLTVTETGCVTAVKKGSATIEAFAAYKDEDGRTQPILNAKTQKEAKVAKLKITVDKVSEVKNIKLDVRDTSVYLDFAVPADGYRREIYVMDGKKTADDFDKAIEAAANGNYDAFVRAPIYTSSAVKLENSKNFKYLVKITGLEPGQPYTVYIRNVSGLRTLDNKEMIDPQNWYAGSAKTVKTFTTTKPMEEAISLDFHRGEDQPVDYDYRVSITAKKVPMIVDLKYPHGETWSEEDDYVWRTLPLSKDDKKKYVDPKLTYFAVDSQSRSAIRFYDDDESIPSDWKAQGWKRIGRCLYKPSAKVTIDKKANVTLKGVGTVYIYAYDQETGNSDYIWLTITSSATAVTGKAIKLKAGSTVLLSDYLTYKEKNIKLSGEIARDLQVEVAPETDDAFEIVPVIENDERYDDNKYITGVVTDYEITAKKPGGNVELTVTDRIVEKNGGQPAKVKLSSAAIDPVKVLKAVPQYDKAGYITFEYGNAYRDNVRFRIECRDQSGKILWNKLYTGSGRYGENVKKKVDLYRYGISGLTRLSTYTVSVTAVYGEYDSKTVSAKLKTTNIPASTVDMDTPANRYQDGGGAIRIGRGTELSAYPLLKSGNTYGLAFTGYSDANAPVMKTDTLTWKSSNNKVASVKPNAGTYTATLKAQQRGTAAITVTSKITKKTIARWTVIVNAVGDAMADSAGLCGYYGDNINDNFVFKPDEKEESGIEALTLKVPLNISLKKVKGIYSESKLLSFTAPSYGQYRVGGTASRSIVKGSFAAPLEKGAKVYILVTTDGTIKIDGTEYKESVLGADMKVGSGDSVSFKAPEADYYTFKLIRDGKTVASESRKLAKDKVLNTDLETLFSGQTLSGDYILQITGSASFESAKEKMEAGTWYSFTAKEDGLYTVSVSEEDEKLDFAGRDLETDGFKGSGWSQSVDGKVKTWTAGPISLRKDEKLYVKLSEESEITAKLSIRQAGTVTPEKPASVTIPADGGEETLTFTAPKTGKYRIAAEYTSADGLLVGLSCTVDGRTVSGQEAYVLDLQKGDFVTVKATASKAGTAVTVRVKEEAPAVKLPAGTDTPVADVTSAGKEVSFTAPQAGWYDFSFTADKTAGASVTCSNASAGRSARADVNMTFDADGKASFSLYLAAGETVTITLRSNSAKETTVTVKADRQKVEKLAGTFTVSKGATRRYEWTAEKEGLYSFAGSKVTSEGSVQVKVSAAANGGSSIGYSLDALSDYYRYGEKRYVTITAGTADAVVEVVCKEVPVVSLNAGTETTVEVAGSGTAWVSFTAKKNARYAFTMTNASSVSSYEGYDSLDGGSSLKTPLFQGDYNEGVLEAGERFYYKFENGSAEKAEVKLKIAEIVPAEVTVETPGSVSAKAAYQAWFRFTAASAGRYEFSAEAVQGENKNTPALLGIQTDLLETSSLANAPRTLIMKAGEVRYICVPAVSAFDSAQDAAVTLKVKKLAGEALTVGADKGLSFKADDLTKYLEFKVPSDGIYTLSAKAGEAAADVRVQYYVNQEPRTNSLGLSSPVSFRKDDQILFVFTSAAAQEVTVTLKQEEIKTIPAAGESYAIKDGAPLYLEVPSDEAVRYFVETYDVPEGVTLSFSWTEGSASIKQSVGNMNSGYLSFVGTRGRTVIYKVTSAGAAEEKKFGIRSGLVTPTEIKDGEVKTTAELLPGHMQWFRFTPQEAGMYTVKAKGAEIYRSNSLHLTGVFSGPVNDLTSVTIDKYAIEQPIFFAVSKTGEKKAVDFKVSKVTPKELTEQTAVKVDPKEVDAGEKVRIHFTAPSDGRYTFTAGSQASIELVQSDNSAVGYLNLGEEVLLNKGDELTFDITYSGTLEKEFEIKVSSAKPEVLPEDTLKKDYTGLASGEVKWLSFTPGKTAVYKFELNGCEISVYPKLNAGKPLSAYKPEGTILAQDQTVYIKVTASEETASIAVKEDTEQAMQNLTVGKNTIASVSANNVKQAYFTAKEPGFYKFEAEGDGVKVSAKSSSAYSFSSINPNRNIGMDAGDSWYFTAEGTSSEETDAVINVEKVTDVQELKAGTPLEVRKLEDGNDVWFKIAAEEKGVWLVSLRRPDGKIQDNRFYVDDVLDDFGYQNDAVGQAVVNFDAAGTKYINAYCSSDYTITLEKPVVRAYEGRFNEKISLSKGSTVVVKYTAPDEMGMYMDFYATESVEYSFSDDDGVSQLDSDTRWVEAGSSCYLILTGLSERPTTVTVSSWS